MPPIVLGVLLGIVAVLLGFGVWMLAPTFKIIRGPDFEPASKDEASIEKAQQSGPATGTGAGGGGL